MLTRQRLTTFGISSAAAATIVAAALLSPWSRSTAPHDPATAVDRIPAMPVEQDARQIDVVFAVDTTSSMRDLIDGAKRTVWSIAGHIRETEPNADLRIGLVAFRDVGDVYVTRPFALTTDLDAVYAELSGYRAQGGGDIPENVDAALHDALQMRWRPGAKKLVFLVGDAPPASRGDVPTYDVLARDASVRGIVINTIRAGGRTDTAAAFQNLAALGNGQFSSIQQDGGVHQVATPYDDKLAELSARIDRTAIIIGDDGARRGYAANLAANEAAPAPAKADRASYYAKKGKMAKPGASGRAAGDLVTGVETGAISLDKVAPATLPADLRNKDASELKAEVDRRAAERRRAQHELEHVAKQREEFLRKNAGGGEGFDVKVKQTLEAQLK